MEKERQEFVAALRERERLKLGRIAQLRSMVELVTDAAIS
jgi:hypothetical protein